MFVGGVHQEMSLRLRISTMAQYMRCLRKITALLHSVVAWAVPTISADDVGDVPQHVRLWLPAQMPHGQEASRNREGLLPDAQGNGLVALCFISLH